MKKRACSIRILILLGLFISAQQVGSACTTFCLKNSRDLIFGKNYDFPIGHGIVFVNKRGVSKAGFAWHKGQPLAWVSKYGSITFNQFGRDNPMGGVNERGLVVELMELRETRYPDPDERPALDNLEWIQYQLDKYSSVEEVLTHVDQIRMLPGIGLHFLLADRSGATAGIEFLNGKAVYHNKEGMPLSVMTNSVYEESVRHVQQYEGFGGTKPLPLGSSSFDRFVRAAAMVNAYRPADSNAPIDYAFAVLDSVRQRKGTKWSIVYDLKNMAVYFRTNIASERKEFSIDSFDFSCSSPVKMFDINDKRSGNVVQAFTDYEYEANRKLILMSYSETPFLQGVSLDVLESLAKHPEFSMCHTVQD